MSGVGPSTPWKGVLVVVEIAVELVIEAGVSSASGSGVCGVGAGGQVAIIVAVVDDLASTVWAMGRAGECECGFTMREGGVKK